MFGGGFGSISRNCLTAPVTENATKSTQLLWPSKVVAFCTCPVVIPSVALDQVIMPCGLIAVITVVVEALSRKNVVSFCPRPLGLNIIMMHPNNIHFNFFMLLLNRLRLWRSWMQKADFIIHSQYTTALGFDKTQFDWLATGQWFAPPDWLPVALNHRTQQAMEQFAIAHSGCNRDCIPK